MDLLLGLILAIRLSSVLLVQTWFVPDEYWQSLEVSHYLVFNFGYLTWEWFSGIRSTLYPACLASVYTLLKLVGLSNRYILVTFPRIFQALITSWAEWCFVKSSKRSLNPEQMKWLVLLNCGSYFLYYIGSRTLANTLEMNLVSVGIAYFAENQYGYFLLSVAISCYLRPTSLPIWLPFLIYFVITKNKWLKSYENKLFLVKCFILVLFFIWVDSYWYGTFTLVPLQFLRFNFMNDLANFYGKHPWHWYLTNALPSLMGPYLVFVILAIWIERNSPKQGALRYLIKLSCLAYIAAHSSVGHKEIRFMAPVIPLLNYVIAPVISKLSGKLKWNQFLAIAYLAINIPAALYLGLRHQRGVIDAVAYLANNLSSHDTAIFLMPCHSTPLYSHIHVNATLRFLTCPPNLESIIDYQDEADVFYDNPKKWLLEHMQEINPKYVILFDILHEQITDHLQSKGFHLDAKFFHADFAQGRVGKNVLILKKTLVR